MTNTALEMAVHDKEVAAVVSQSQRDIELFFGRLITQAQADGDISARLDAQAKSRALLGALLGLLVLARSRAERPLLEGICEQALENLTA